jgi:hypothetical protein
MQADRSELDKEQEERRAAGHGIEEDAADEENGDRLRDLRTMPAAQPIAVRDSRRA